jgi:hypothetical protein
MSCDLARRQRRVLALCACFLLATCFAFFAGSAQAATDWDGDGYADNDCAPLDPAVNPGATDKPDMAFEDTNCDGIDGDKAKAIFVSLGGNDAAPGTLTNPMRTITNAVIAASTAGKDVYVAGGDYVESVGLADGVGIYGGYEPITGKRAAEQVTEITGAPAALAFGDSGVVLQMLTLDGRADAAGNAYGLRAVKNGADSSSVLLDHVTSKAALASGNNSGFTGGTGLTGAGFGGGTGGNGGCGNGVLGLFGGSGGGNGGFGGGINGNAGTAGSIGTTGEKGAPSAPTAPDSASWTRNFANSGAPGGGGGGGGGGRGGAGATLLSALCGGKGANGGTGGGGGFGGGGGQNGGGSFGAYVLDSSLVAIDSVLEGGPGGNGGNGGNGGFGGSPTGAGGAGAGQCETFFVTVCAENGFAGGSGGPGGRGGGGAGGTGGPSAALFQGGIGSSFTQAGTTTLSHAAAGAGGLAGNGSATRSPSGVAVDVLRSATAPTTSGASDFDGDGITDASDACPGVARGTDADGDGCPDRPAALTDANGNGIPDSAETSSTSNTTTSTPNSGGGTTTSTAPKTSGTPAASPAPAPRVLARVAASFKMSKATAKMRKLIVSALKKGDKVKVTCRGKGCPFKSKTVKAVKGKANMLKLFKKRALAPKAVVTVWITRKGAIGQVVKFTMAKGKKGGKMKMKRTNMCVPVGKSKPQLRC